MESPPKRVTRARAAAKGKAHAPVKVATAAAKAKATRTMPPPPAPVLAPAAPITKRRTRGMTEEIEEENTQNESTQQEEPEPEKKTARTTRGRATRSKAAQAHIDEPIQEMRMEEAPKVPVTRTRRTAVKKAAEETPVEVAAAVPLPEDEPAPKPAPSRITRRVVRKVEVAPEEPAPAAAPAKRTARSRAATTTKPAASKKSVDFAEAPELNKENVVVSAPAKAKRVVSAPIAKDKALEPEPAATGLRAKPVRKPAAKTAAKPAAKTAVPAPRTTRGRTTSATSKPIPTEELIKSPLSPKKVSQLPQPTPKQPSPKEKEDSDDELATMEKTPMRPLEKTPFKAPASVIATAKLDFTTSVIAHPASTSQNAHLGESIMASPARRIPQSPWKGAIKDSAKKAGPEVGQSLLQSPKKLGSSFMTSPFKSQMGAPSSSHKMGKDKQTLMQSPARRPPSPVKVSRNGSPTRAGPSREPFGATPRAGTFGVSRFTTPKTLTKSAFRPGKVPYSNNRPQIEARPTSRDATAPPPAFGDIKPFTGRLSSVLPRYADPVMRGEIGTPVAASETKPVQEPVEAVAEKQAPADEDYNVEMSQGDGVVPSTEMNEYEQNGADGVQASVAPTAEKDIEASQSTTPTQPPAVGLTSGTYALRDESPFDDTDSENESEDELATNSPLYTVKMSSAQFAELSTPRKQLNFQGVNKTPIAIGFSPLASQLNKWHAPTPGTQDMSLEQTLAQESPKGKEAGTPAPALSAVENGAAPTPRPAVEAPADPSPAVASSFFDDEMLIRDDEQMMDMLHDEGDVEEDVVLDALEFAPEDIDDEDLDLVEEANELSMIEEMEEMDDYLMGQDQDSGNAEVGEAQQEDHVMRSGENSGVSSAGQSGQQSPMETAQDVTSAEVVNFAEDAVVNAFNCSMISALSEASQEYGDENAPPSQDVPTSVPVEQTIASTPLSARRREKQPSAAPTPLGARRLSTPKVTPKVNAPLAQQTSRRSSRPFTPADKNTQQRTVHTVSKVPLKPAAAESPIKFSPRKMPATVARGNGSQIPRAQMPTNSSASRTANTTPTNMRAGGMRSVSTPTPTKVIGNAWSNTATPARSPVRPAAEGVLNGAVVFVDVHTTEGADASAVFIDLLTQMGARCVKSWGWNPSISPLSSLNSFPPNGDAPLSSSTSSNEDAEADSRKIGITHVVFKDGSKRTMEKVRDTKGVVSCVGVGWVLDCEREARWLDEAEYKIDTAHVPRGGARRRKSMEPRALANMNGTLVTPNASKSGVPQTEKPQRFGRRESTQWARNAHTADNLENETTPKTKKVDADGDIDMLDYSYAELSPLPQTPAPANIPEYSQHDLDKLNGLVPETPYHFDNQMLFGQQNTPFVGDLKTPQIGYTPYTGSELTPIEGTPSEGSGETPQPLTVQKVAEERNQMIMRTVPAKRNDGARQELNSGADSQALMQRLMAARRKSLQWAPKIGSPLARGSNYSPQK